MTAIPNCGKHCGSRAVYAHKSTVEKTTDKSMPNLHPRLLKKLRKMANLRV